MHLLPGIVLLPILALCTGRQGFGVGEQDWGYITVRPGAHMFWWLYYTTANVENYIERPLIIWLQGGPGASSTGYGNFAELGPLDMDLETRNLTWVRNANVLFIDNPVGSGFSYVDSDDALCTNNTQIAEDLVEFMKQFYDIVPEFKKVPLYVFGQSYGGKMAVEFVLTLHKTVEQGSIESNIKGIGLGNSWISPIDSVLGWGPFLFHMGVIDSRGLKEMNTAAGIALKMAERGDYLKANAYCQKTMGLLYKLSYGVYVYNVLKSDNFNDDETRLATIMNGDVKAALNLSTTWTNFNSKVYHSLAEDFMKPVANLVEEVLNTTNLKVFVYSGQLDVIVETIGTVKWIENLRWKNKNHYNAAERQVIKWGGSLKGYVKSADNFAMYWINMAGHSAPAENPEALEVLLRHLTNNYKGAVERHR